MSIKNMFESVISKDSHMDDKNERMTDGSGLMMDEGGDDLGDLEGLASDKMGGFENDDLGDINEVGSDTDTDELEHRLGELEKEVSSLSSTVSTVRSENEQISGSIEEVEENVRKLLDIYEMVTRGVNPFTDDVEAGMGGGGMGDDRSFGLFDEGDDSQEEEIDEDMVNADAEGFFDEELSEDTSGEELAADGSLNETNGDGSEDDGGFFDDDSLVEGDQESGDGTTFQDLKNEYESGDAEWEKEPEDGAASGEETVSEPTDTEDPLEADDLFSDSTEKNRVQNVTLEVDTESEPNSEPIPKSTAEETSKSTSESESTADTGKPYLVTLPSHYTGDLIVMEWLEYLIQQAGYRETTRAIEYYETIDWIAKDVADDLQTVVRGFDDIDEGDRGLTIDHHTQSLEYISQLDESGGTEAVLLSKLGGRGGPNGL